MAKIELKAVRKKGSLSRMVDQLVPRLSEAMDKEQRAVIDDFQKSTASWKTNVRFDPDFIYNGAEMGFKVTSFSKIYAYVNFGTPPHLIYPRSAKMLVFGLPYTAKTKPGSLNSSGGGGGNQQAFAREVRHPGTAPRRFDQLVVERGRPRFIKRIGSVISSLSR